MNSNDYVPGDRRPVAARNFRFIQIIADGLSKTSINANQISIFGMGAACLAGVIIAFAPRAQTFEWFLWLVAAVLIELRLLANLFDGMVAINQGTASPLGELYNEAPDRISDAVVCIGLGYASGDMYALGYIAALFAVFTAYIRILGALAGASQHYSGIMAKQMRMQLIVAASVLISFLSFGEISRVIILDRSGIPAVILTILIAGCIATLVHRLKLIVAQLNQSAVN